MMNNLISKMGGRKLVFTFILLALGFSVDFFTERGLSSNLKELIIYLGGIYIFGNGVSKVTGVLAAKKQEADTSPAHEEINAQLEEIKNVVSLGNQGTGEVLKNIELTNRAMAELMKRRG